MLGMRTALDALVTLKVKEITRKFQKLEEDRIIELEQQCVDEIEKIQARTAAAISHEKEKTRQRERRRQD